MFENNDIHLIKTYRIYPMLCFPHLRLINVKSFNGSLSTIIKYIIYTNILNQLSNYTLAQFCGGINGSRFDCGSCKIRSKLWKFNVVFLAFQNSKDQFKSTKTLLGTYMKWCLSIWHCISSEISKNLLTPFSRAYLSYTAINTYPGMHAFMQPPE